MPQSTILVQSITSGSNPQIAAEQLAEGYKELEGSMIRCNPFTILESLSNLQIESEELAKGYKELEGCTIQCNPCTILESFSNLQIESEQLAKGYKELERGLHQYLQSECNHRIPLQSVIPIQSNRNLSGRNGIRIIGTRKRTAPLLQS